MDDLFLMLAAGSAAIAAFSLAMLIFDLLQKVELEKAELNEDFKRIPLLFRMMMPFVPNLLPLVRSDVCTAAREKASELVQMSGYDQAISGEQFCAIRILSALFGALFSALMFFAGQPLIGVLTLFIACFYPTTWLRGIVRRRHVQILKALPNVLDLLTLSVEAGKDFLTALRDIVFRRKMDALGEEFRRTLHEIQLGKQRQQALREMARRVQQGDLTSVINAIIQADELGVSIGQLLRIQGDQLRSKRFSRAEKQANETPVKILFPVIVFIFPSVFIILMGPILMQSIRSFGG